MSERDADVDESGLMPQDSIREGVDPIAYAEGVFATVFVLGAFEWAGYGIPARELLLVGGIGMVGALIWEVKYE